MTQFFQILCLENTGMEEYLTRNKIYYGYTCEERSTLYYIPNTDRAGGPKFFTKTRFAKIAPTRKEAALYKVVALLEDIYDEN